MPFQSQIIAIFISVYAGACSGDRPAPDSSNRGTIPYDLEKPAVALSLHEEALREISGLSPTSPQGEFIAIADERGELFFLDSSGKVTKRVLLRDKGDFEGVEMVGGTIWAVKSDGKIFGISNWEAGEPSVEEYKTELAKSDDIEGLGYDSKRNALLLAAKGNPDSSYSRNIYAFSLATKQLDATPVYSVEPSQVNEMVPYGESEKHDNFSPSGIAVNPVSGDIYLISSALKRLVVLDGNSGKVIFAGRINKKQIPQPEGVAFDASGNLYISSEGKGGDGLLLRFDMLSAEKQNKGHR
jgi:uncharacterized protein YjiK